MKYIDNFLVGLLRPYDRQLIWRSFFVSMAMTTYSIHEAREQLLNFGINLYVLVFGTYLCVFLASLAFELCVQFLIRLRLGEKATLAALEDYHD